LNDTITFAGVENLAGGEDTDDTFVLESGGSLSGSINGGAGEFDNLIIRSATETVVVNPDASGTVSFDGRTVHYAELEFVVDTSDPAVTRINATSFADDLILELDPSTPGNLRLRSNGTRFLNNGVLVSSLSFVAPTESLALDLRSGDDRLAFGNLSGVAARMLVAGGIGNDRLAGSNIENVWQITAQDGGTLNGTIDFAGIENLFGGNAGDTFSVAQDASLSGSLEGGAGTNTLKRLIASTLWTVTGANAGHITDVTTSEIVVEFAGMANLSGDAEGEDTFYLAPAGTVSGLIDGGSGGVDQLLIEGTSQTVLVIPDASGIATFGGRTVHYAGLEPFVDLSDPAAIIIHATALDDDLMLSDRLDQVNEPDGVELSSSLYRFSPTARFRIPLSSRVQERFPSHSGKATIFSDSDPSIPAWPPVCRLTAVTAMMNCRVPMCSTCGSSTASIAVH
jgi:hypothetical protein